MDDHEADPVDILVRSCDSALNVIFVLAALVSLWRIFCGRRALTIISHSQRLNLFTVDLVSTVAAVMFSIRINQASLLPIISLCILLVSKTRVNSAVPLPEVLWLWLVLSVSSLLHWLADTSQWWQLGYSAFAALYLFLQCRSVASLKPGYDNSTVFGKITVSYMHPLLDVSIRRPITRKDLAELPKILSTGACYKHFTMFLGLSNSTGHRHHLLFVVLRSIGWKVLGAFALSICADLITYLRSSVLAQFLRSIRLYQKGHGPISASLIWGSLIAATQLVTASMASSEALLSNMTFVSTRSALMGSIYHKALALSPKAKERYPSSKIMNLLNVDTAMIQLVHRHIINLAGAPIGLVVCSWQIYHFVGPSAAAAIPVLVVFIPFSYWYTRRMFKRFPEMMAIKDSRTKAAWNIFQNIKSLKLHAWEDPYEEFAAVKRKEEVAVQSKYLKLQAIMSSFSTMLDDFLAIAVFLTYLAWTGNALTPEVVFPTLSLLSYLSDPFLALPRSISGIGRCITAQHRIAEFLAQPEICTQNYHHLEQVPDNKTTPTIEIRSAVVYWSEDANESTLALKNINLDAYPGDLCCILGRVGSGKSSLLKTLTKQMYIQSGSVAVTGKIAYFSQDPWLQFDTIRANILFGAEYEAELYEKVLTACDLKKDLTQLPLGDQTEIGEKGICLSGGQKARVALARAVYSCADIYVMDDFLAAVDEHVSSTLIAELLAADGLLAGKTVVLSTNSHKVLALATKVFVLEDKQLLPAAESNLSIPEIQLTADRDTRLKTAMPVAPKLGDHTVLLETIEMHLENESVDDHVAVTSVFGRYLLSSGKATCISALLYLVFSVITLNTITIWLSFWSNKALQGIYESRWYATLYFLLTVTAGIFTFLSLFQVLGKVGNKASTVLHAKMIDSVVNSPMQFFESTPLGSIMNRFTGDVSTLDTTVPQMIHTFSRAVLGAITSIAITIGGVPLITLMLGPLFWLYNRCRALYLPPSRQLQRMSAASRGPILSHIEESLKGLATISAFGQTEMFTKNYELRSDSWMKSVFMRVSLNQWLNWRVSALTALLTFSAVLSSVALVYFRGLSAGVVGVVLHNTQRCGMTVSRIIKTVGDLEVSAVSVQRIFEYIDLKPEGPRVRPESDPNPEVWPSQGAICMDNLSVRYRPELEPALKSVSLQIQPREKIGIVGRTGAGKSTISLVLFRIIEPFLGTLAIDGLDTAKLGLRTLRQGLSIIPQDAQIFQGTLRQNLDPLGQTDDSKLWQILRLCHLSQHFAGAGLKGLDSELSAGGDNLSRGQAQLICLGRSLVHESRILVLDEATGSVDKETDQIVQQTIRSEFADRTIVTIAHRLDTIMDSDRILVLEKGQVVEFDTPSNLLALQGAFWRLCQAHAGM